MKCKNCKKEISMMEYGNNHGICNECKHKKEKIKQTDLVSDFSFPDCQKVLRFGKKYDKNS